MDFEKQLFLQLQMIIKRKNAPFSSIGVGSAARSVEGPVVLWGEHVNTNESSNLFGVRWTKGAEVFNTFRDTILLVDKGRKR
ncbi:MAG: hypothetical protein CM15mP83_4570 [Flavobacteriaceae bacterium]|nr:MAG: hypothetical protein CM15mP83_4570 [Flavobacteriaceae bacterium]